MTQYAYNSSIHSTIDINFFYVMYDYNSEIELKIENDFFRKRMSTVKKRIKKLHKFRQTLSQRWTNVVELQIKYYNQKHKLKDYKRNDLIMLFAKNLKQKRFNKKLSHKFLNSFRILKLFDTQTYRLTLFSTYNIYSIFHVFLLKSYRRRENDSTVLNMFFSEIINDQKEWEIEKIKKKKNS